MRGSVYPSPVHTIVHHPPPQPDLMELWRATGDGWSPLLSEPMVQAALEHLRGLPAGAVVLDVGSEAGHLTAVAARAGARAIGVDVRAAALAHSRERYPEGRWLGARAEALPLADGCVDAVLAVNVLQYTDRARTLAESRRVLRPGGRFVAVENLRGNPIARAFRLGTRLSRVGYRAHYAPREYVSWGARALYRSYFGELRFHVFHLLAPGLAGVTGPAGTPGRAVRALVRGVRRLDDALLAVPPLRHLGWQMVVCGIRE